jgi:hypothetical protein
VQALLACCTPVGGPQRARRAAPRCCCAFEPEFPGLPHGPQLAHLPVADANPVDTACSVSSAAGPSLAPSP